MTEPQKILVVGAGILGLWQALRLARAGHAVVLCDRSTVPFAKSASQYAGAMIAPYCEAEAAPDIVMQRGLKAAHAWREVLPELQRRGSLVLASARDQSELRRFESATIGHQRLDGDAIAALEPELAGRFQSALFYPDEAHMTTPQAMRELLSLFQSAGGTVRHGQDWDGSRPDAETDWVVDCRGYGARDDWPDLRGVRGERILLHAPHIKLTRPVRMLHPRYPLYVVPWTDARFLVGATVIESEDTSEMTVRSALELLGLAYALHPGFGEAEILQLSAGVRPSLPDNVPAITVEQGSRIIRVNGAYRHGFLLAPELARAVGDYIATGASADPLVTVR